MQGVGFRYFAWSVGRNLGVVGFVRNDPDGAVSLDAEGEPAAIEHLLAQVGRGPAHARVEGVELEDLVPRGDGVEFGGEFMVER